MKRGMSSLIATVLLISFGVMLAIFVMNWGTDFIRSSQRDVEQQSKEKFSCTTDVAFEIRCECTESGNYLDECQFKITNNEDSIIKSASYRLFRGEGFLVSNEISLGVTGLEAWEVSDYFSISDIPSETLKDNVKLEVLATQIETGGITINCGNLAKDVAKCIIVSQFS